MGNPYQDFDSTFGPLNEAISFSPIDTQSTDMWQPGDWNDQIDGTLLTGGDSFPPSPVYQSFSSSYQSQPLTQTSSASPTASLPAVSGSNKAFFCTFPGCDHKLPFQREQELQRHNAKHTRPFRCQEAPCDRQFATKADMQRHRREVHLKDDKGQALTMHVCPVTTCKRHTRGFPRHWNMLQHYQKIHGSNATGDAGSPASQATPYTSASDNDEPTTPPHSGAADFLTGPLGGVHLSTPSPGAGTGGGVDAVKKGIKQNIAALEAEKHRNLQRNTTIDGELVQLSGLLEQLEKNGV